MKCITLTSLTIANFVVAGLASQAPADVVFYTNQGDFNQAMLDAGKVSKGFIDFENMLLTQGGFQGHDDPLNYLTADPGFFLGGFGIDNLSFQSNDMIDDGNSPSPDPGGSEDDLILFAEGVLGADNFGIGANSIIPNDGFDIISGFPESAIHTGMELSLVAFGGVGMRVRVYDLNDDFLGETIATAPITGGFLGIQTTNGDAIGRVNLYDLAVGGGNEAIYSVGVYEVIPVPGSLALIFVASIIGLRSRKRHAL